MGVSIGPCMHARAGRFSIDLHSERPKRPRMVDCEGRLGPHGQLPRSTGTSGRCTALKRAGARHHRVFKFRDVER